MKTKLLFFSVILIFLFGCSEKKSKIEILTNFDAIYLPASEVSETAIPVDSSFYEELQNDFKNIVEKIKDRKDSEPKYFAFGYRFYINENGKIDKVKTLEKYFWNRQTTQQERTKRIKMLVSKLKKYKFIPAKISGQNVKSRYDIELGVIFNNGKLKIRKNGKIGHFEEKNTDNDYFVAVEQMPAPIGGIAGIQKRITYPEIARKAGIQGRVFVKAFIDGKGNVVKTEILKGIGAGCDEAAIKAVEQTKFVPGRQRGQAVKVQVSIPILFRLDVTDNKTKKDEKNFYFWVRSSIKIDSHKFAKLKGRIFNTKHGILLTPANIMLADTKFGAATDEKGYYLINNIKPGKYSLFVRHNKYGKSKSKIFTFKAGYEYTIDVGINK